MGRVYDVVLERRTIRRFRQEALSREDLMDLVRAGAYSPSAGNGQPWHFIIVDDSEQVRVVNQHLGWLGGAPSSDEEPVAHIVLLISNPRKHWAQYADGGAAMQTMSLVAWERGIGSCWIGSFDRDQLRQLLGVPEGWELFSVLALGRPAEEPRLEETASDRPRAYRDETGTLVVQKRPLTSILSFNRYGQRT